jgi:signal transduction histidine kinase/CheY-like chemotaxis protein
MAPRVLCVTPMRGVFATVVVVSGPLVWAAAQLDPRLGLGCAAVSCGIGVLAWVRLAAELQRRAREDLSRRHEALSGLSDLQAALGQAAAAEVAVEYERACRRTLEGQRAALQAELDEARASRAAFLATVSHELRTPLHAIVGFTELVSDGSAGPVNDRQREYLEDARAASRHLMRLITDVLDFAKCEAGRLAFSSDLVPVRPVVEEVLSILDALAAKKELVLECSIDEGLMLTGDALRVKQVLLNLVGNAVKFTPRRGRVVVTATADAGVCKVSIRDTGPGIAPQEHWRIFEPFHQADASTARHHSGTGLGLALVKRWCEAMGGSVELDSEPGRGSCFTVGFPRQLNVSPLRKAEAATGPLDVLVAEDDDTTRLLLTRVLESRGCAVRQAPNGQRALEAIMARLPEVLVLDLMMPELDGHELLRKLRGLPGGDRVRVLVVSASSPEGEQAAQLEQLGAEVLLKGALNAQDVATRAIERLSTRTAA